MALETNAVHPTVELTSDQRWATWIAKGREHDRKIRKRAGLLLVVIAVAATLTLLVVVLQ